jgi:hypothetical protein
MVTLYAGTGPGAWMVPVRWSLPGWRINGSDSPKRPRDPTAYRVERRLLLGTKLPIKERRSAVRFRTLIGPAADPTGTL